MAPAASLIEFGTLMPIAEEITILPVTVSRFRKQSSHLFLGKKKEEFKRENRGLRTKELVWLPSPLFSPEDEAMLH